MTYRLKEITIRTNNSEEGIGKIVELWKDIQSGKLAILFDSDGVFCENVSPVSKYSNYSSDENGDYDFSIIAVGRDFFQEMDAEVEKGTYVKFDGSDDDGELAVCSTHAWEKVWKAQTDGKINRAFSVDYESNVPAQYTKDGKAHCYLYIAVK